MNCINCQTEITGKFCPKCGQRASIKRINFKEGWFDFWSRIYGFDGMFPRTLRDLTLRPGVAAHEYIQGNRVKYYGPVGYFFLMITLLLLLLSFMNVDFAMLIRDTQSKMPLQQGTNFSIKVTTFMADNIKWVLFLGVPFQAFAARYCLFRKSGFNFLENMILPFYTTGHLFWLTMFTFVFYKIVGEFPPSYIGLVSILFYGFSYSTFINYQSKVKSFFKGMLVYVLGQVFFILLLCIVVIAGIIILVATGRVSIDTFK